jgi:hypothetical protein
MTARVAASRHDRASPCMRGWREMDCSMSRARSMCRAASSCAPLVAPARSASTRASMTAHRMTLSNCLRLPGLILAFRERRESDGKHVDAIV